MRSRILVSSLLLGALALAPIAGSSAATKPERGYITKTMVIPSSSQQANTFGRDMDGDGDKDNQLGHVFATLAGQGLDLTGVMDEALTSGDIVMLHSLRTFSLANTRNATWQVWYGRPTPNPDLSGGGTFTLLPGQPHSVKLAATIKDHVVRTVVGAVPVRLDIGSGPFLIGMKRAKIVATCTRLGCSNGRINGALNQSEIDNKLIPELAELLTDMLVADCDLVANVVVCDQGSGGDSVNDLFNTDEPKDLQITVSELQGNTLIQTLFRPDLNLVTGDGGADDHISFGFGFSTAKATLVRP